MTTSTYVNQTPPDGSVCRRWSARRLAALLTVLLLCTGVSGLDVQEVPPEVQVSLMLRVLGFDRNLEARVVGDALIAIVYQSGNRDSVNVKEEIEAALEDLESPEVKGHPVSWLGIDLDQVNLEEHLLTHDVDLIYVTPLRAVDIEEILGAAREARAMSVTGVRAYEEESFSLIIEERGSKPSFRLDLFAAKAEDVDFHPDLYKVAAEIKGRGKV